VNIDSWSGQLLSKLTGLLVLCVFSLGSVCANQIAVYAQSTGNPLVGQPGEDGALGSIDASTFRFNDLYTTPFGPAYADIWLTQSNFLTCKPPVGRPFSYALCYFSGPAVGTPAPSDGSAPVNPPLPCALSQDGKSANCTCYEIKTEQYPPFVPYFVNINAILNLDLYLRTVAACGHDGELCGPQTPIRDHAWWNPAPACRAVNTNNVIPTAELVSVFSTVKTSDYATGTTPNSTLCPAGKYAGCMTAPCYHTGKTDSAGNELVECKCPVYDGPFELGQAGVPCDANELTPPGATQTTTRGDVALQNARVRLAQAGNGAGQLDPATVEAALTSAGVDLNNVQSFMARFFPPTPPQGYSDFYTLAPGMGYSPGEWYGNQSSGSEPPDNSAALAQFNALIDAAYSRRLSAPPVYVWSAAHNPKQNPEPIDPPATGCLPDVPGDKGCPLYSPMTQYPVAKGSPLCTKVCNAYRNGVRQSTNGSPSGIQVGYSCDATLCTTLGIGQTAPPPVNPLGKANLLQNACGGLAELSGLRAILALEQIDQCSCCASQVCGCDIAGVDIDAETQAEIATLNAQQEQLEITPQCQINGTLCGAQTP
jgi:hypothetical protein